MKFIEDLIICNEVVSEKIEEIKKLIDDEGNRNEIDEIKDFILDRYENMLNRYSRISYDGKVLYDKGFSLSKEEMDLYMKRNKDKK